MGEQLTNGLASIAQRYANAFVGLAEDNNKLDEYNQELKTVQQALDSCSDLKMFLEHPNLPLTDKKETIDGILKSHVSSITINFIKLLLDKNRMFLFPSIARLYDEALSRKRNILRAEVITAIEITEETENKLKQKLETIYNNKVELSKKLDKDIIAGVVVKIADKTIDGSVRTKLENMKKQVI